MKRPGFLEIYLSVSCLIKEVYDLFRDRVNVLDVFVVNKLPCGRLNSV